jgi:hypothetical protein
MNTTITLREEIKDFYRNKLRIYDSRDQWFVDEIIKIIEKRIDSKLKRIRELDPKHDKIVFTQGYNSAIYDIGEMLK